MTSNDNSVNIESSVKRYHHGDLRSALIEEGLRLLGTEAQERTSLREIARNVGVSATAVYRHFPDKTALLKALCLEGDRLLADASRIAKAEAGGGRAGFDATGRAYVRFALDHPALFRLMMSNFRALELGEGGDAGSIAISQLLDDIAELTPAGIGPASDHKRRIGALQSWAIVHGLATLMLDGLVPPDEALIAEVIRTPGLG